MNLVSGIHAQILVVNRANGTIGEYATSGAAMNPSFISGLQSPTGMAVAGDFLYVAQENGTVRKYTTSGSDLYVTAWTGDVVGKYTTSGATVNASFASGLVYPGGLALDDSGFLYGSTVSDGVRKYTTSGALVDATLIPNAYNSGVGLAYDGNGHLLVANNYGGEGGNIIGKYTTSGAVVDANFITGLSNPVAIALVPEPGSALLLALGLCGLVWRSAARRVRRLP